MPVQLQPSVFGPPERVKFDPEEILKSLHVDAMVETYADRAAADAYVARLRPHVMAINDLLPQLHSTNAATSGNAARRISDIMKGAGLGDGPVYGFLNSQHVTDAALRHGNFNVDAVNPERQIKSLIPAITGSDREAATNALIRAQRLLKDHRGFKGPEPFYHWLSKNVKDDDVLRGAGIDPEEMRRATHPGDPHPDVAALLEISRSMMAMMVRQNPALGDMDATEAAAAYRRFTGSTAALPTAGAAPGVTVRDLLALPIRA